MGPLEVSANLSMNDSVEYSGKQRAVYPGNIAKGEGKGYGIFVQGDSYFGKNQSYSLLNIADYTRRKADSDYAVAA